MNWKKAERKRKEGMKDWERRGWWKESKSNQAKTQDGEMANDVSVSEGGGEREVSRAMRASLRLPQFT